MDRQIGTKRMSLPWLRATLISLSVAMIGAAFYGIIGNRADLGLTWLLGEIGNSVQQGSWVWWVSLGLLLVICIGISLYSWQRIAVLSQTLERSQKMLALDDSLLRFLASWPCPPTSSTPPKDRGEQLQRILKDLLRDATIEFNGEVQRAAVLLPDPTNSCLRCWAHYQMPEESIESMEFYIGQDSGKQRKEGGVAGISFHSREILVGHMVRLQLGGEWICKDQARYIPFRGDRPFTPYISFVTVPIITPTECIGIVCFDSKSDNTFDSPAIKIILQQIARRVASALLVSEKLV